MCGIAGHWALTGRELKAAEFARFLDSLAHRGPDGRGIESFADDRLWLGHRRLSIIDLSDRGRQPMSYADGRYWLTFNGEIYNYIELRDVLRGLGYSFTTATDSEVLLAAYAAWGPECQLRFNGMWAFAIWDNEEKQLFLSRDRFGVKPLLYSDSDGCFSFASEVKSFLQLDSRSGGFDESVAAWALLDVTRLEATSFTLLTGVKRLLAGHCLTVSRNGTRVARWWNTLDHLPAVPAALEAQVEQFRELFIECCRIRLRSDVPVATSLSGGLDSSAVACAIAALRRRGTVDHVPDDWQRAVVACFPGTTLDERGYAEQVAAATGLRPAYHEIEGAATAAELEDIIFGLEDIFLVPLVGAWAIYRQMRRSGIRVSLDGHGADELLGGYHFFVDGLLQEPPATVRRYHDLREVRARLAGGTNLGTSGELLEQRHLTHDVRFFLRHALDKVGLLQSVRGARRPRPAAPPLVRPPAANPGFDDPLLEPAGAAAASLTTLGRQQYEYFHARLLPTFLRMIDRASMAHGIEVRCPFLDWRLVTLAFALPDDSKIAAGYTKRILRLAMKNMMPEPVRLRTQKIHFSAPIAEWSRDALKPWLLDISSSRAFLEASAWNGPAARREVEKAVAHGGNISAVWPILNAHVLKERFRAVALSR